MALVVQAVVLQSTLFHAVVLEAVVLQRTLFYPIPVQRTIRTMNVTLLDSPI